MNLYQIDAVMPAATTPEQANLMLGSMLVERFGLKFHRETRDTAVYLLTVGSKPRLEALDPENAKNRVFDTPLGRMNGCSSSSGTGRYTSHCASMYAFASTMDQRLGRPVVDHTGLPEIYDISLQWDPSDPLDLISVIQRELGLKLENGKMPFEMFVVDHINPTPTAN
jgi:uncharacterized protein (TIGR03435 family)